MLIKICGLCTETDAREAIAAGADLVGFIFVEGTPRFVDAGQAQWIRALQGAETVGVFRDSTPERMLEIAAALDLDRIQLHGSEPDDWLNRLDRPVVRRVPVPASGIDRDRVAFLAGRRVLPLVDPGAGDGVPCDWRAVSEILEGLPFGLAGGLDPDNVARALSRVRPAMVDVSSGVERAPGIKDPARIRAFIAAVRAAAP